MKEMTAADRRLLREMAARQMEAAHSPENLARREEWHALNDLVQARPMIHVETWTFEQDLLPELRCETEDGRRMERQMQRDILNYERIGDDRVVPDFFGVSWQTWFRLFDLTVKTDHATDTHGRSLGHQFVHQITDIESDLPKLKDSTFGVERDATEAWRALAEETFGDVLPVHMTMDSPAVCLSQDLVHFMGMEPMLMAIMDSPEAFHELMDRMVGDHIRHLEWKEREGLLLPNNGCNTVGNGTFGFSHELFGDEWKPGEPVRLDQIWGFMDSQETIGISPAMFDEFFFPYYKRAGDRFALLSYGCCEPVDPIWEKSLSRLQNLRKVSISPWCNEEKMGQLLRGKPIIYHRKPSPNFIGVDSELDLPALKEHLLRTLKAAEGCRLEFSFRDVYTTNVDPEKPRRVVKLLRELIGSHWQG